MKPKAKNIFFLGKGGVGKSTVSVLNSLQLSRSGSKVLLVSLDPAHNLSDIFEKPISDRPVQINSGLFAKEVDREKWIARYLESVQGQIQKSYQYLTALNLEKYFGVFKNSLGIEEYALLLAYQDINQHRANFNYVVYDMPPTALALKFFGLPWLSLKWISSLVELRQTILEKRQIISRIQFGPKELEGDKILRKLQKELLLYESIKSEFQDPNVTEINLVLNTDKLSLNESVLIQESLAEYELTLSRLIVNKWRDQDLKDIEVIFKNVPFQKFPTSDKELVGLENILKYLDNYI